MLPYGCVRVRVSLKLTCDYSMYYFKYESLDPLNMYAENKDHIRRKRMHKSYKTFHLKDGDSQTLHDLQNSADFDPQDRGCGNAENVKFKLTKDQDDMCVCSCCISSEKAKLLREIITLLTDIVNYKEGNNHPTSIFHSTSRNKFHNDDFSKEFYDKEIFEDDEYQEKRVDDIFRNIPVSHSTKNTEHEEQFTKTFRQDYIQNPFVPNPKITLEPTTILKEEEEVPKTDISWLPIKQHIADPGAQQEHKKSKLFSLRPFFFRKN